MSFLSKLGLLLVLLSVVSLAFSLQASDPMRIAAASSLRYALDDILTLYRESHPNADIEAIYGSSGKMTAQIMNGAPFDIFFSADFAFPELLKKEGYAATDPVVYATGRIVIWSSTIDAANLTFEDMRSDSIRRIAIAQPAHAPYGLLAKEAMQTAGVWDDVQDKLVFGENIAHAAQMAQSGAAEAAIIALSLARSPVLAMHKHSLIDKALHNPLMQGYVITRRGGNHPEALTFAEFMTTDTANTVLIQYGFITPE